MLVNSLRLDTILKIYIKVRNEMQRSNENVEINDHGDDYKSVERIVLISKRQ